MVDVPAKLSARARALDTGHNRKTDPHDAHAVAVVAVRTRGLRVLSYDVELEALWMLVARREELTRQRVQTINRLQRLLSELTPARRKGPDRLAGQGNSRLGTASGPRGQDPQEARPRAADRPDRGSPTFGPGRDCLCSSGTAGTDVRASVGLSMAAPGPTTTGRSREGSPPGRRSYDAPSVSLRGAALGASSGALRRGQRQSRMAGRGVATQQRRLLPQR